VWPFKFVIPITALLLLIQGVAELLKDIYAMKTGREWVHREQIEIG
jgi:TRAP-type mannitol/chloroaromatic compound transport system permease small subunit